MGRGKRGKSRTQRKHFQQNRENVWTSSKRSKSDPSSENPIPICNPYATQNLAFDHYYKANQTLPTYYFHTFLFYYYSPYLLLLFHLLISFLFEFSGAGNRFLRRMGCIRASSQNSFARSIQNQFHVFLYLFLF